MSIPLPNLDDRTFSDLVEEMQAIIPRYAPEWTDHNASDPGIMLVELFAWLTEALIYRVNRIPEASVVRMLELLGFTFNPAQPATVDLRVTALGFFEDLIVPQGTPLTAGPDRGSTAVPFETVDDLKLTPDQPSGKVQARQTALVEDEPMGTSDGRANQAFRLAQPFLAGDAEGELFLCRVKVGGEPWTYKASLLDLQGYDFAVDPRAGAVYFGEGERGRIPAQGKEITVTYRTTRGVAGNVPKQPEFAFDERSRFLPPSIREALDAGVLFYFDCLTDAYGGTDPTGLDEARDKVRQDLQARWRAVTQGDFAQVALEKADLNLARAVCLAELDLSAPDPFTARPGHISVIVVPKSEAEKPEPAAECLEDTWKYLDERRLITCRHHVVGPAYTDVAIKARVVRNPRFQATTVQKGIETNLREFFHPLRGGPGMEKMGWPFGRDVYASEVYQVLENTEGVDHVESLTVHSREDGGWREASDWVAIAPHSLVHLVYQADDVEVRAVH